MLHLQPRTDAPHPTQPADSEANTARSSQSSPSRTPRPTRICARARCPRGRGRGRGSCLNSQDVRHPKRRVVQAARPLISPGTSARAAGRGVGSTSCSLACPTRPGLRQAPVGPLGSPCTRAIHHICSEADDAPSRVGLASGCMHRIHRATPLRVHSISRVRFWRSSAPTRPAPRDER